jgi:hypothetical protein
VLFFLDNLKKYGRVGQATEDTVTRRMRFSCWLTKATNTHSEYEIFTAFPWQQLLIERAEILCYTCSACLVEVLATSVREAIFVCLVLLNKVLIMSALSVHTMYTADVI